jgi:hypothetical protein
MTMQRWKNFFWISAGIIALTAVAGVIAPSAIAQVRAALVRDMDSPIRGTRHNLMFSDLFAEGSEYLVITFAPSIPAGRKLFLQSISVHANLTDNQSIADARITLFNSGIHSGTVWVGMDFQAEDAFERRHFVGNEMINTLLNPGEQVSIQVRRSGSLGSFFGNGCEGSIIGYLVDANP